MVYFFSLNIFGYIYTVSKLNRPVFHRKEPLIILDKMAITCLYTGAGHIIRISSKSLFISLIPFKKLNLYNVYIHSTQTDIFQVFISFHFDDYN